MSKQEKEIRRLTTRYAKLDRLITYYLQTEALKEPWRSMLEDNLKSPEFFENWCEHPETIN